jgi:hypothetical protein
MSNDRQNNNNRGNQQREVIREDRNFSNRNAGGTSHTDNMRAGEGYQGGDSGGKRGTPPSDMGDD